MRSGLIRYRGTARARPLVVLGSRGVKSLIRRAMTGWMAVTDETVEMVEDFDLGGELRAIAVPWCSVVWVFYARGGFLVD